MVTVYEGAQAPRSASARRAQRLRGARTLPEVAETLPHKVGVARDCPLREEARRQPVEIKYHPARLAHQEEGRRVIPRLQRRVEVQVRPAARHLTQAEDRTAADEDPGRGVNPETE